MVAAQVAVFMRHHGQRLGRRQAFQQRQAQQQVVAREADEAQRRPLHDGGIDLVGPTTRDLGQRLLRSRVDRFEGVAACL